MYHYNLYHPSFYGSYAPATFCESVTVIFTYLIIIFFNPVLVFKVLRLSLKPG